MPWEKQFDVDQALAKAMQAFWARGYEATSMQDLVTCMGLNRGSLYATFGDKRSLFIQALRRYDETHRETWLAAIRRANGPRDAVLAAFEAATKAALDSKGASDGCFLVNTALELSPHDAEIGAIVARGFAETEDFFHATIAEGQAAGEIPAGVEPRETAQSLLSLFIGLRVLARSRPEPALLRSIAKQAEALLS
jgi:TetR/AcrR family transcriptional repressor of nem operon